MQGCGVIVKLVTGAKEDMSCSGMYLGHGVVLTHGTLLVDLFKDKRAQPLIEQLSTKGYYARMRQEPSVLDDIFNSDQSKIEVILPSKEHMRKVSGNDNDFWTFPGMRNNPLCQTSSQSHHKAFVPHCDSSGFLSATAHFDRIIAQSGVYECLESLMPTSQGWKLLEENQNDITSDLEKLIMSTFVLLILSGKEWSNEELDNNVIKAAKDVMSLFTPIQKGNFVYVESSPFGSASPSMFLNSVSHGIICNTGPKGQEEVLLTDARCITGSEGAPVFVVVNGLRRPCAVVISPFCWQKGEWLGLTLLASLGPVLQTLLQSHTSLALLLPKNLSAQKKNDNLTNIATAAVEPQLRIGSIDRNFVEGYLSDMSKSVVCIKCGKGWGSGVVISSSPGIILTCAHVTYKATNKKVAVVLSDGRRIQGTVIHETQPLITSQGDPRSPPPARYSMWDLAVVVTCSPLHPVLPLPLSTSLPPQGVGVVMAGYGMFPSRILSTPTLSRGVISKVVTLPSSLLHLPSRETSDGASSEEYTHGGIDHDNNFTTSDTSKINTTTIIRRDLDHVSHYLMKLGITSSDTSNKSVPVPVVMQTSCSVYAGASGGPVVALHPSYGLQVVGLVVCNMQDSNRVTFPHVNLAIPIPSIATILNTFIKTKDKTVLRYLDIECAAASHVWGLTDTSRSQL